MEKFVNIKKFIKNNINVILFFKYKFLRKSRLLFWQRRFINKTFLFLYFWYIFFVNKKSLVRFSKFYNIFLNFYKKLNFNIYLNLLILLNRKILLLVLFCFNIFIKKRKLLKLFEKSFLKIKFKQWKLKNIKLLIKFYIFLKKWKQKKQSSKKYKLNKINKLFILFNLYFLELCFFCFHKTFYKLWNMYLNNEVYRLYLNYVINISSINNVSFYFKNYKFLNIFQAYFFKNVTHLKSYYYKKIKIKKAISIKYKTKTKNIKIDVYKRKYKYFQLLFKNPISIV